MSYKFNKDELTNAVCDAVIEAEQHLSSTFHRDIDKWEMDRRDKKYPKLYPFRGCANFSVNVTSSNCDSMTPRILEGCYDWNEPTEAVATDVQDIDNKYADTVNRFNSWDTDSHDDYRESIWNLIDLAVGHGTSFAYTYWKCEKDTITSEYPCLTVNGKKGVDDQGNPVPYNEETIQSLVQKGYKVKESTIVKKEFKYKKYEPETICLDSKDVGWNKDAISLDDAFENGFVYIKIRKTLDEIKVIAKSDPDSIFSDWEEFENILKDSANYKSMSSSWNPKKIEFKLVFTKANLNPKGLAEKVVLLIHTETKKLIGLQKYDNDHGECPVVAFRIKPVHLKVCGIGIPELLWHEKGYLDSLRNQMCDNRTRHNDPTLLYTEASKFNPAIHRLGLNAQWRLADISESAIRYQQVTPIHNDIWTEFAQLQQECNKRVGLSDINHAQMPSTGMTFRGMMMLNDESTKNRSMYTRNIAIAIQRVVNQRFKLYGQHWGKEKRKDPQINDWINHILGANSDVFKEASQHDIFDHKFNIILKSTYEDRKINQLREQDVFELLSQSPDVQSSPEHMRRLYINLLRANGVKDPESYYPTKEQMEDLQQQRVLIAQKQIAEEQAQKQAEEDKKMNEALKAQDLEEIEEIGKKETEREIGRLEEREKQGGLMGMIESEEQEQDNAIETAESEL